MADSTLSGSFKLNNLRKDPTHQLLFHQVNGLKLALVVGVKEVKQFQNSFEMFIVILQNIIFEP